MKQITFTTNVGAGTLEYTKLLLKSLKENLDSQDHEIIVFVDKDTDGTVDYLRSIKDQFVDLKIVTHKLKGIVGYQRNSNLLVDLAKHDIVSYLQSDMVVSKHYDTEVIKALEENTILSSTRIEPPLHGPSDKTITKDFGLDPLDFKFKEFVEFAETVKKEETTNYFFAPYTFHKETWKKIGGYDTVFRRAREDSDFVQRCLHANINLKQTFTAVVYHFTCVSSRGKNWFNTQNQEAQRRVELQKIADGIEIRRFLQKWGNFNHGDAKLNKLDIDLVLPDTGKLNPMFVVQIEPFFSRIWVQTEEQKSSLISIFSNQHDPANELLGFSLEDWDHDKEFYNQVDFDSIYKVGTPDNYNIKVDVDFSKADPQQDVFLQNLTRITSILEGCEPGTYELGSALVDVKNVVSLAQDQILVKNPPFDMSLLTIE
jgi:GT2 family glycosyltransferase